MKTLVYCETIRKGRRFYPERSDEAVGYRLAREFTECEEADMVLYDGDFPEIKEAYEAQKETDYEL